MDPVSAYLLALGALALSVAVSLMMDQRRARRAAAQLAMARAIQETLVVQSSLLRELLRTQEEHRIRTVAREARIRIDAQAKGLPDAEMRIDVNRLLDASRFEPAEEDENALDASPALLWRRRDG